jgi:hypothetical protein
MTGSERRCQVSDLSDSVEFLGENGSRIPVSLQEAGKHKTMISDISFLDLT